MPLLPRPYTVLVTRGAQTWVTHLPALDRTAHVPLLAQVDGAARDLVAAVTGQDAAAVQVEVEVVGPPALAELLAAADAARANADRVSLSAVAARRRLVRRLAAEGLSDQDVAHLLGISPARVLHLLPDAPHPPVGAATAERMPMPRSARDASGAPTARSHESYRHEAFLYRTDEEFVRSTLDFVQDGLALGQAVMVVLVPSRLDALRSALPSEDGVVWVDMTELGRNPARIVPAWRAFVDRHGGRGRPVRGVGEPVWAGRRPVEVVECQLHEALLNLAVDPDTALWLRCPYDAAALDTAVLEEAARSHPALVEGGEYRGSTTYGGAHHASTAFRRRLPEPAGPVEEIAFDAALADLRPRVLARAGAAGLSSDRSADLALAVWEAATNSVRHAGGEGVLRVWEQDGALVCEVRDSGRLDDLLVGRRAPDLTAEGGRGLWLVNQLSDLVQVRSDQDGSAVRVHSWL